MLLNHTVSSPSVFHIKKPVLLALSFILKYSSLEEDPYLYRGRGLLEVVGPMGTGAAGSGRFRVGEQVWRGRYKRRVCGRGRVIV